MKRFLEEARARKLDRVAAAYAVIAWVVVQAASIAFPAFGAPSWALQAVIIAAIIGLPVALFGAWRITRPTPEGGRPTRLKRYDTALLILLGGMVVISAVQLALSFDSADRPALVAAPAREASIAVLPFANMSGDPSREYFSDGISEELLNSLANTSGLRVAARTSSFAFKGRNVDAKEIGRLLNVTAVLEGSIREEGNRVRITAQLIDTSNGYHMWSQTYDRELKSILAVQEEIARDITRALIHRLLPARAGRPKIIAPEIYSAYLQGKFFFDQRNKESNERAIVLFKRVVAAEPGYADGWAALAYALVNRFLSFEEPVGSAATSAAAKEAMEKALALDPNHVIALLTKLNLALGTWDWDRAAETFKRMRAINPNNAIVLRATSNYCLMLGVPACSIAANQENAKLDPLSFIEHLDLAEDLIGEARYAEAETSARAALAIAPADTQALHALCLALAATNRPAEARAIEARLAAAPPDFFDMTLDCSFEIARHSGDLAAARKIAERNAAEHPDIHIEIGTEFAELGDIDRAMDAFEKMFALRQPEFFSVTYDRNLPRALYESARWKALTAQPEFRRWQAAHDRAAAELRSGR
jgi:TolB-like protein